MIYFDATSLRVRFEIVPNLSNHNLEEIIGGKNTMKRKSNLFGIYPLT